MDMERDLERVLGGLVSLESRCIRIVDSLAERTLKGCSSGSDRDKVLLGLDADDGLVNLCLHYLILVLSDGRPGAWEKCLSAVSYKHQVPELRDSALDFLQYACRFWPTHFLRLEDPDENLKREVISFLRRPKIAGRWFQLFLVSNGLSPDHLASGSRSSAEQEDLGGPEPVDHYQMITSFSNAPASRGVSPAAIMAGYVGLTSILPDLIDEDRIVCEPKVVHVARGDLERDIVSWDSTSVSFMECAIAGGDEEGIKHFLQENREKITEYLPMHKAVLSGRLKIVQMLFEELADLTQQVDSRGRTLLHMAAVSGRVDITRYLVERTTALDQAVGEGETKAIDFKDENSQTPLILAVRMGHADVARYLAQCGANILMWDGVGKTALHYAVANCPQVVQDIVRQGDGTLAARDREERTPLHIAASLGLDAVTSMILIAAQETGQLEEAVDAIDTKYRTPLHYAAKYGHEKVAELLVNNGANVETEDAEFEMAAELAAKHGQLLTMEALAREHAEIGLRDRLLRAASASGQLLILQYLLENDVSLGGEIEKSLRGAAMFIAAFEGRHQVVAMLLRHGADVNWHDSNWITSLHFAAKNGFAEVAQALLEHQHVNVNALDLSRYTPLHWAASCGQVDVAMMILEHKGTIVNARSRQKRTPLHLAIGSAEMVRLLLKYKAEVDVRDTIRQTPLHIASRQGKCSSAELLIKQGADVDLLDFEGFRPAVHAIRQDNRRMMEVLDKGTLGMDGLDKATYHWHNMKRAVLTKAHNVLEFLVSRTPDVLYLQDDMKRTLVHWAVSNRSVKTLTCLLDAGAPVNETDKWKRTPLFIAALRGDIQMATKLLERGADVDLCNDGGLSPLHVGYHKVKMTKLLVKNGADVNLQDSDGWTMLHIVAFSGSPKSVKYLLNSGADPKVRTKGETCLELAIQAGETENVAVLVGRSLHWSYDDLVLAYRKAVEERQWTTMKLLADREPRVLDNLVELDEFLRCIKHRKEVRALPTYLTKFLGQKKPLGFKQLRAVTEIVDWPGVWKKLKPFVPGDDEAVDADGWNIHHFLHQAGPGAVTYPGLDFIEGYELDSLQQTKAPSAVIFPSMWLTPIPRVLGISDDGLAVAFESKY